MARSRSRQSINLKDLNTMTMAELRQSYTVLRDIFQKRIGRASRAGFGYYVGEFEKGGTFYTPTLKEIGKLPYLQKQSIDVISRDLQFRIRELNRLLEPEAKLSITGITAQTRSKEARNKIVEGLQAAGYDNISASVIRNFGRFMDEMRLRYGKKLPNSEEMVEFFDSLKYNTKRKSVKSLVELWEDYQDNAYQPTDETIDLFRV